MEISVDEMPRSAGITSQKAGRIVEAVHTVHPKHGEVVHISFSFQQPDIWVVLFVGVEGIGRLYLFPLDHGPVVSVVGDLCSKCCFSMRRGSPRRSAVRVV